MSALRAAVGGAWWILPLCESLHFIGMAMLVGVAGVVDLRILGLAKGLPLGPLQRLLPWAVLGFAINLVTGFLFFAGNPRQYIGPPLSLSFVAKMLFIVLAGMNVVFFYATGLKRRADGVGAGHDAPFGAKVCAAVSLFLWIGVMYWGRMLQFFGKGF
jgi:hypothetical protein